MDAITLQSDSLGLAKDIADHRFGTVCFTGAQGQRFVITAVSASGHLRLIAWRVLDDMTIRRLGAISGGDIDLVDIARVNFGFIVTAVRLPAPKRLRLIWWKFDEATGLLQRMDDTGDIEQAPIDDLSLTSNGDALVAVASGGKLVLKRWTCDQFGKIKVTADTGKQGPSGGSATQVVIRAFAGSRVYTASRSSDGKLRLNKWTFGSSGAFKVQADSGNKGGSCARVPDLTSIPEEDHRIVTAGPDGNNNLEVIAWHGATLERLSDSGTQAGGVSQALCRFDQTVVPDPDHPFTVEPRVLTAAITKRSTVKLIPWQLKTDTIERLDDFGDNTALVSRLAGLHRLANQPWFLLTHRDREGRLRLRLYRMDKSRQPAALDDTITLHNQDSGENTVRILPPAQPLGHGRIVLHMGSSPNNPRGDGGGGFADRALFEGKLLDRRVAKAPPSAFTPYPMDADEVRTDNQIIRLQDGSLLAIKQGRTWSDISRSPPLWFSANVTIGPPTKPPLSPKTRGAVHAMRSDNGRDWQRVGILDSATVHSALYSGPRITKPDAGPDYWWYGGFDRVELYQDPWTKDTYISGGAQGGLWKKKEPGDDRNPDFTCFENVCYRGKQTGNNMFVAVSKDRGATWAELAIVDSDVPGGPYTMTSTSDSPLIIFTEKGLDGRLYWVAPGKQGLQGPTSLLMGNDQVDRDQQVFDVGWNKNTSPVAIARIGATTHLLIAYPTLNEFGRQVYQIGDVDFALDKKPAATRIATIEAQDPKSASCIFGTFARDELLSAKNDHVMFSWIEAPPTTGALSARFRVFFGEGGQHRTRSLTLSTGGPVSFPRKSIGDYTTSAGCEIGGLPYFLAMWRQSPGIRGNVVTLLAH